MKLLYGSFVRSMWYVALDSKKWALDGVLMFEAERTTK